MPLSAASLAAAGLTVSGAGVVEGGGDGETGFGAAAALWSLPAFSAGALFDFATEAVWPSDLEVWWLVDLPLPSLVALAVEGAFDFVFPSEAPFDCPSTLDFEGTSATTGVGVAAGVDGDGSAGGAVGAETGAGAVGCDAFGPCCTLGDPAT